jgi:hypothetical protein
MLQQSKHVLRRMKRVADPSDRPTSERRVPHCLPHDVKQASEGHDPFTLRTLRLTSGRLTRLHRRRRRITAEKHAANLMQRSACKPTAERRVARPVTKRDLRSCCLASKPSLARTLKAPALLPTFLPQIDARDLVITRARNHVPWLSGIAPCQKALHITRILLRTLLLSRPSAARGPLPPHLCMFNLRCNHFIL